MYNLDIYKSLTSKYGPFASWAIWSYEKESDTSVISKNIDQLHSKYVLLGLNISRPLRDKPWSNFHGGKHDRKIKYACNNTKLRGSYITDIFKGIDEPNSSRFKKALTNNVISKNVNLFNQEMSDIKINKDSQFIVFGMPNSLLANCFNNYFKQNYKNRIIYYYHYSYYRFTDKMWVEGLWEKLKITDNYKLTIDKYK